MDLKNVAVGYVNREPQVEQYDRTNDKEDVKSILLGMGLGLVIINRVTVSRMYKDRWVIWGSYGPFSEPLTLDQITDQLCK